MSRKMFVLQIDKPIIQVKICQMKNKFTSNFFQSCLIEVDKVVKATPKTAYAQRRLVKHKYSFSYLPFEPQILIWDYIWKHADAKGWVKTQAFFFCESFAYKEKELIYAWDFIKHWQNYVTHWGECDALAKLYTKILEFIPNKVLPLLKKWNTSSNQWMRRQSVVSLLYFQRTKKRFLPFEVIIKSVDNLLDDKEYYVQKGVGWTLKELYQVYPKPTFEYLKKNIKKIKPAAYTPAIEKLTLKEKQELKRLRK
jgi:3-methyladenine DNA glycosylase AlkD